MLLAFSACGAGPVLNLSRREAAERLGKGDIGFILTAEAGKAGELAKLEPSAPFYAALLAESAGDRLRSALLFEAALQSPIGRVRTESVQKLVPILAERPDAAMAERIIQLLKKTKRTEAEFITIQSAALYVLGRYTETAALVRKHFPPGENAGYTGHSAEDRLAPWNRAFLYLAELMQQKPGMVPSGPFREFFFGEGNASHPACRWVYEELVRRPEYVIPQAERTAAAARLAAAARADGEALLHFDSIKSRTELLFRYPSLINDMGRAFIATASRREEGCKLFTGWESTLRTADSGLGEEERGKARYSLLFYAGRIRRQQGKHSEAVDLFTRALSLAPNAVQKDACIWYILSSAFQGNPGEVPGLIKIYAQRWNDDEEFYDILDRLSTYLTSNQKWNDVASVFASIRSGKDGASIAKYAYLTGRAVSLGYISGQGMSAGDYFTIAYEEGNASFYYRALAASQLGKTINVHDGKSHSPPALPRRTELEFYAKFFEFGAGAYAMPYLREHAARYTKQEMQMAAVIFAGAGRYLESIQIVGMYMRRDGYVMDTADLKLYYPAPFTQLIERHAVSNGLHPQVFFGLVRTESAFIPDIVSHAGAVGLAQLMPSTAREVAAVIKRRGGPDFTGGDIDLTNPEINVHMGAVYLKNLTDSLGSPMLALLAYNGGPGRIRRLRQASPSLPEDLFIETINIAETRNYGKRVMAAAAAYGYLYYGMSMHDVVSGIFR